MVRRALAVAAVTVAAGVGAPAEAVGTCDFARNVCVYVNDARDQCPTGTGALVRLPRPNGGVYLLVCVGQ